MQLVHSVLFTAAAFAPVANTQERLPVAVSAETSAGAPWAGATVSLLSRTVPDDERFGTADLVRATTDDAGRCTVRLLTGRSYTAWAVQELDGAYRISAPAERVTAAVPVVLRAGAESRAPVVVRLEGIEEWRERGELSCIVLSDTQNVVAHACRVDDRGRVRVPPMPGNVGRLEVLCGERPLFESPEEFPLRDDAVVSVRPPKRILFRVLDRSGRRGVPQARIHASTQGARWWSAVIEETDDLGFAIVELPLRVGEDIRWEGYPLLVTAPGFAPAKWVDSLEVAESHDADVARAERRPAAVVSLEKGRSIAGAIVRDGRPIPGLQLRAWTSIRGLPVSTMRVAFGSRVGPQLVETDEHGAFRLETHAEDGVVFEAFAPSDTESHRAHPLLVIAKVPPGADQDLGTIELASLPPTRVSVLTPDGSPADSRVSVAFAAADGALLLGPLPGDRLGRCDVVLPAATDHHVFAWSDAGFASATLPRDGVLTLRMERCDRLSGRVVRPNGEGVAGVEVPVSLHGIEPPLGALAFAAARELATTADDAGRFSMPRLPGLDYTFYSVGPGADPIRLSKRVVLRPGVEPPEPFELVIR